MFYGLANPEVVRDIRLSHDKLKKVVVFLFSLSFPICLGYNLVSDVSSPVCLPGEYREDNQNGRGMKKRQIMEVEGLRWLFCLAWSKERVK